MLKITEKPIQTIPLNAMLATHKARVGSVARLGCPDEGVCKIKGDKSLYLMSWGLNADRAMVAKYGNRRFVWVGQCAVDGQPRVMRDNYEEAY